jgi:hypothetical protein
LPITLATAWQPQHRITAIFRDARYYDNNRKKMRSDAAMILEISSAI